MQYQFVGNLLEFKIAAIEGRILINGKPVKFADKKKGGEKPITSRKR